MGDWKLGYPADAGQGDEVVVPEALRDRHCYLVGNTGMGKTALLETLILSDLRAGRGFVFLDPHGDASRHVIASCPRDGRLLHFDATGQDRRSFGINLFSCPDPEDEAAVAETADQVVEIFKRIWATDEQYAWGARLADLLRAASITLIEQRLTLAEMGSLFYDDAFRLRLAGNTDRRRGPVGDGVIRNYFAKQFWREEFNPESDRDQRQHRESTMNKVRKFLYNPVIRAIVGQSETTLPLGETLDGTGIILTLPGGQEDVTTLLGCVVLAQLKTLVRRIPEEARRPVSLYADEFELFATTDLAELLTQGRKFRIGVALAHQNRAGLTPELKAATLGVGTVVLFKATPMDAADVGAVFAPPDYPGEERVVPDTEPVYQRVVDITWDPPIMEHIHKTAERKSANVRQHLNSMIGWENTPQRKRLERQWLAAEAALDRVVKQAEQARTMTERMVYVGERQRQTGVEQTRSRFDRFGQRHFYEDEGRQGLSKIVVDPLPPSQARERFTLELTQLPPYQAWAKVGEAQALIRPHGQSYPAEWLEWEAEGRRLVVDPQTAPYLFPRDEALQRIADRQRFSGVSQPALLEDAVAEQVPIQRGLQPPPMDG